MAKKVKHKPNEPRVVDLPVNPEFDTFAEFTRELMKVPKTEIDRRVAEEEATRKQRRTERE